MTAGEYDFVVVKTGTSELIVAPRLSKDPNLKALVVEARVDWIEDS